MTIIVRKPFEPFEGKDRGIANRVVHPEFEEKPVVEPITQTSEDAHGGSEVTFSLPDSPNNSPTPNERESQNNGANNAGTVNNNDNQGARGRQNQEQENVSDESGGSGSQDSEDGNETNQGQEGDMQNQGNEQAQSGVYNTQQVVDVASGNINNARYYQTEFWRFIELIAEEKTRAFDPMGSDEYNVKKLMFRQFERKSLGNYKMSRVRESVVIVLDNSGSMQWWASNLQVLAELAMQRNDVEVYLAPNGHIEEMIYPKRQLVNHDEVVRGLRNRRIIYVGDFDGADTPIELSWYNDVIWICPEERYTHFLDHDWVHYDEGKFRGAFLRVFTLDEMFNAFRRLLSNPSLKIWHDLCNESHKCGYDEGDEE